MIPAVLALGLGALSAGSLIKQLYRANTEPDPAEIQKIIDDKAINISRREGIPVDAVREKIKADTIKEIKQDRSFNWGEGIMNALGVVPGIGVAAKGVQAARAAGSVGAGVDALKGMGFMEAATGGMMGKGTAASKAPSSAMKTAGEEAAEVANPAMRAAHGAEEAGEYGGVYGGPGGAAKAYRGVAEDVGETGASRVAHGAEEMGEYGGRSAMPSPKMDPAFAREYPSGTGFTLLESADPANAVGMARRMDAPRIGLGQQNFKTVDVPYEVISPPYNPTLGLPFDEAAAMDEMFRNQLGGIYSQQVRRFPLISDEGRSRATAIMANLQNG